MSEDTNGKEEVPVKELKKQLWQYAFARESMAQTIAAARIIPLIEDDHAKKAMQAGMVVSYAKHFIYTKKSKMGILPRSFSKFDDNDLREAHRMLIKTRHEMFAHSHPDLHDISIKIETAAQNGESKQTVQWISTSRLLKDDIIKWGKYLAEHQQKRLNEASKKVFAKLCDGRLFCDGVYDFKFDDDSLPTRQQTNSKPIR